MRKLSVEVLVLVFTAASIVYAHDTWLLARARTRIRERSTDIHDMSGESHSLVIRVPAYGSALAMIWVEVEPKSIDLTPSQVAEYLDEIDAPTTVRQRWAGRYVLRNRCGDRSDAQGTLLKTDADGRVHIPLAHAGRWMLRPTDLRWSGSRGNAWRSDFTTLTLDVC